MRNVCVLGQLKTHTGQASQGRAQQAQIAEQAKIAPHTSRIHATKAPFDAMTP